MKNLAYSYERGAAAQRYGKMLLNNISFEIPKGKITTLIGPNGCGKTTLLRLINGLTDLQEGQIIIEGRNRQEYSIKELARIISVLPQSRDLANITVERLVEHGRFPYLGLSRKLSKQDRQIMNQAMATAGVEEMRYKKLEALSGGERQRAYIAMMLAQDTPIVMLDEPTTYLDIHHQFELLEMVKALNEQSGKTVIMILHDLPLALKYSDNVVVLHDGAIQYHGIPDLLVSQHTDIMERIFHVHCQRISLEEDELYVVKSIKL